MRQGFVFSIIALAVLCAPVLAVGGDMGVSTEPLTDGSETYPWLIEDLDDFDAFAGNSAYWAAGVHTRLMTDIDLAGHSLIPIGSFYGIFDGDSHVISNATINMSGSNTVGLFSYAWWDSEIKNLSLVDGSIAGDNAVGGLVGINHSGTISNCHFAGTVAGNNSVGGLVGSNSYGIIENCSTDISVTGAGEVGGLVGSNYDTIDNCFVDGTVSGSGGSIGGLVGIHYEGDINISHSTCFVTGDNAVGGLVGRYLYGIISGSYATGTVQGGSYVGGLTGIAWGLVEQCFANCNVSGNSYVGGLSGDAGETDIALLNCYAMGQVEGADLTGGFVGVMHGASPIAVNCYSTVHVIPPADCDTDPQCRVGGFAGLCFSEPENCFWDTESSGTIDGVAGEEPDPVGVEGKTTAEMQTQSTFTGWDFTNTWFMSGYPALSWQADFGGGDGSESNPYLIENIYDFDKFSSDPNYWASGVYTKLMTDIDLSGRTYTDAVIASGTSTDSGFQGTRFSGVFDGNGYTICNLTIDMDGSDNDFLGLFGYIEGSDAEVKNLGLENTSITSGTFSVYLGGLCGVNNGGTISNSYTTGAVTGGANSEGLGGLCGSNYDGLISNCYATGAVTGGEYSSYLGGLCGHNSDTISDSYATGTVTSGDNSQLLGGLCGSNYDNLISNCYATSAVTGGEYSSYLGGLCGFNIHGTINSCYAIGTVNGDYYLGGLCGGNGGTVSNSYFLDTAGPDNGAGDPLTDSQMKQQASFVGWDFSTPVWMMLREGEDYPRLAWQEVYAAYIAGLYGVDMVDFAEVARNWGNTGCPANCEDADIDESGDVGLGDLLKIAENWLSK